MQICNKQKKKKKKKILNPTHEELKLDESDDDKYDDEYVYSFKCWDYILNYVFWFLWI